MSDRLSDELGSFGALWPGGYYDGNPLEPLSKSGYGRMGYMSVLHATYLRCIKPYVNAQTVALEIGPGRGAWTKALLASKEVWVLDALSAEHNGFYEHLGNPKHVRYFQVSDFSCRMLPDNYFTYMFTFGCLCHVSFQGIKEYAANLYPKLKTGSNCFWMVADYEKHNYAVAKKDELDIWKALLPAKRRHLPLRWLFKTILAMIPYPSPRKGEENDEPLPGRWYDAGIERTCTMLEEIGYEIIDPDVGTIHRDPIIHFIKS